MLHNYLSLDYLIKTYEYKLKGKANPNTSFSFLNRPRDFNAFNIIQSV